MDKATRKREYKNKVRGIVRLYLQDYKSTRPCSCGEKRHYCLIFHHKDRTTKCFDLSQARDHAFKDIVAEVAKCRVMCANCHSELHFMDDQISRERVAVEAETEEQLLLFE